jgi:hypothetical protein
MNENKNKLIDELNSEIATLESEFSNFNKDSTYRSKILDNILHNAVENKISYMKRQLDKIHSGKMDSHYGC